MHEESRVEVKHLGVGMGQLYTLSPWGAGKKVDQQEIISESSISNKEQDDKDSVFLCYNCQLPAVPSLVS